MNIQHFYYLRVVFKIEKLYGQMGIYSHSSSPIWNLRHIRQLVTTVIVDAWKTSSVRGKRNYLATNNTGQTLDTELLPQLINIIFCKIYDERYKRGDSLVAFRAGINEEQTSISKRIQDLFINVKKKYPDVFDLLLVVIMRRILLCK